MTIPSFDHRVTLINSPGDDDRKTEKPASGQRVYWMQSAQRFSDNMALNYALKRSSDDGIPFSVAFFLSTSYPSANLRHFWFMMEGIKQLSKKFADAGINFCVYAAPPWEVLPEIQELSEVITERAYLRHLRAWRKKTAEVLGNKGVPLFQVESEVVVPCDLVSEKQEYAAATIRRKITGQWLDYLHGEEEAEGFYMGEPQQYVSRESLTNEDAPSPLVGTEQFPVFTPDELQSLGTPEDFMQLLHKHKLPLPDKDVPVSEDFHGGEDEAHERLSRFLSDVFPRYGQGRNDPADPSQSEISPYLHFGMISPLRIAWEAVSSAADLKQNPKKAPSAVPDESLEAYLEELIVRRELARNFVLYNPQYDSIKGIPEWAQKTIEEHRGDQRAYIYSREELEKAKTHDPYWNACQREMLVRGKMHGYMRMYWGKKVIEWSETAEEAFESLKYLNDKYELDGRDENGYAGISWCFGTHDRGWTERGVFGKLRYMNDKGLERKFKIKEYAQRWSY